MNIERNELLNLFGLELGAKGLDKAGGPPPVVRLEDDQAFRLLKMLGLVPVRAVGPAQHPIDGNDDAAPAEVARTAVHELHFTCESDARRVYRILAKSGRYIAAHVLAEDDTTFRLAVKKSGGWPLSQFLKDGRLLSQLARANGGSYDGGNVDVSAKGDSDR